MRGTKDRGPPTTGAAAIETASPIPDPSPVPPRPLTVAIDARLFGGASGGIEQMVIGLVDALSGLGDGDEHYLVLAYPRSHDWIAPYVRGPCELLLGTGVLPPPEWKTFLKAQEPIVKLGQHAGGWLARKSVTLSTSDGTIERAGADVVHFMLQRAFFTSLPSIYHPHDLQHLHLPHFFSRRERVKRDVMLRSFCTQARVVSVTSSWVKRDVVTQYGLPDDKVYVVPLTGALGAYPTPTDADLAAVRAKFDLPEAFVFYPAQTWPHKNHVTLLEALALLRAQGLDAPLVCSGRQTEYFPTILRRAADLGLSVPGQARFLGFVSPLELQVLYRLCRCVCVPTRFEAASAPLNEAFMAGAPACCSAVTSLPEQAAGAALLFSPDSPAEMAAAIRRLWTDAALRTDLAARGRARVAEFTWPRAARHFRALYRRLAGRPLTDEDRRMLSAPPGI